MGVVTVAAAFAAGWSAAMPCHAAPAINTPAATTATLVRVSR